jgi:hypothetical protein
MGIKHQPLPQLIEMERKSSKTTQRLKVFFKVIHCPGAKDLWDKLQNIYEGYAKVKGAKIQIFRSKFDQLKMKEDEDIVAYLL